MVLYCGAQLAFHTEVYNQVDVSNLDALFVAACQTNAIVPGSTIEPLLCNLDAFKIFMLIYLRPYTNMLIRSMANITFVCIVHVFATAIRKLGPNRCRYLIKLICEVGFIILWR